MALHLRFSVRVERLLEELGHTLDNLWTDLGDPVPVVVPSPSMARWLKLRLCERGRPVLGLPTPTLESALWARLQPEDDQRLLRVPALQQAVLRVLEEGPWLAQPEFAQVKDYLNPSGQRSPLRKVQFAHEMARIFLEYEYNRPSVWDNGWKVDGIDRTWPHKPYFDRTGTNAVELWQRRLHGAVFGPGGPLDGTGWLGLPRLHALRRESGWVPSDQPMALFSVDKISHFHRNLLQELSQTADVHLFLVNPCAEFWEDIDTSRRGTRTRPDRLRFRRDETTNDWNNPELGPSHYPALQEGSRRDPPLLERWGRTARENIALWCQATDYSFEDLSDGVTATGSLLASVQKSLEQRHPGPLSEASSWQGNPPLDDGTLRLLECPERGREMEAIRDHILSWLAEDSRRAPSDVVVYLPDPSRHRSEIERVFGGWDTRSPGSIPYTVLGASVGQSRWAQGVESILRLLRGPFDRAGVFGLLRNPLCQNRLRVASEEIDRWELWAEETGILRGWDRQERQGESPQWDTHTFRAGILRQILAPLVSSATELGLASPQSGGLPCWRDLSTDPSQVELYASTLERLHIDIEGLRQACTFQTPLELGRSMVGLLDAWMDVQSDDAEAGVRRSLADALELLELRGTDHRMEPMELSAVVQNALEGDLPGSARAWSGALTFAPLRAGHILPHGLVVVAGLDADAFPGTPQTSTLDLLSQTRIVGDSDPVADNRHVFLLALLAARSQLLLTWRSKDLQREQDLSPSSVVQELEEALRAGFLSDSIRRQVRLLAREAPRQGSSPEELSWDPSDGATPEPARELSETRPKETTGLEKLSLHRLRHFLLNSWIDRIERGLFAVEEEALDTLNSVQETLESSARIKMEQKRTLLPLLGSNAWSNIDIQAVEDIVDQIQGSYAWHPDSPEGLLLRRERDELRHWAREIFGHLSSLKAQWPAHRCLVHADLSLGRHPALKPSILALRNGESVRLTATVPLAIVPLDKDGDVLLLDLGRTTAAKGKAPATAELEASLDLQLWPIALALAGWTGSVRTFALPRKIGSPMVELDLLPLSESWLADVVEDFLAGHAEYLPLRELVPAFDSFEELRLRLEESKYPKDIERMLDPLLPGEADSDFDQLTRLVERRFGPLRSVTPEIDDE